MLQRIGLAGYAAGAALTILATPAFGQPIRIDIDVQPLGSALNRLAVQGQRQILFTPDLVANQRAPAVHGTMPTEAALTRLLDGTGLQYRSQDNVLLIERAPAPRFQPTVVPQAVMSSRPSTDAAETTPHDDDQLGDIVVTAEKRSESLQNTPISLTALDATLLARNGISNVGDLAYRVPSLSTTPFPNSPNAPRLFIRGIGTGDPQVTTDVSVGVYLDGVYLARSIGLGMDVADIARIEVLRGPQGTLYGRNTTGGAINIVTVRPGPDLTFSQDLTGGNFGLFRSKTVVNVPLSDNLYVKGALLYDRRDGLVENTGVGKDFGAYEKIAGRLDVRWQPSSSVTIDYSYDRSHADNTSYYYQLLETSPLFEGVLPENSDRLKRASLPTPYLSGDSDTSGHALTVTIETPLGELKSISAYRELNDFAYQDYSANSFLSVTGGTQATDQNQFSQELQLVGASVSNAFEYVVGAYFFRERGRVKLLDTVDLIGFSAFKDVTAVNEAYAGYAQLGWRPGGASPFSLTLGGRYSIDDRHADNHLGDRVGASFERFTPSIMAEYAIGRDALVYAKIVTGYKSGGFNLRSAFFSDSFEPETLTSYEVGWKTEWLDRRLRINGAAFYADYRDIQLDIVIPNQPNPTLTRTENAGKANVKGLELDIDALPAPWLRPSLSYSYLDGEVTSVIGDDVAFYRLQNMPRHQLTARVDADLATLPFGTVTMGVDYNYKDHIFTSARPNPPGLYPPGDFIPSYSLVNARLSISGENWLGKGRFELSAWVRNLFDKEYLIEGQGSFYQLHATRLGVFGDPRMVGVDFRFSY
ncbi:TonB-dependent receptor [Sphingomonas sp. DBB INV C78]|uniref:TonB-dependent receptor domain-containing protein n=1 Tax=Sphingomonas sp. DBB INV C78 TaxID=3349434 RepID=UPI0036D3C54D